MKQVWLSIFLLLSIKTFAQSNVEGEWVLDKISYTNGKALEVNHPLFSVFIEYDISRNNIKMNDKLYDNITIDSNAITTNFLKIKYSRLDDYLIIEEPGDETLKYFLKKESFIKKYPEFSNNYRIINDTCYIANKITEPRFRNALTLEEFLRKEVDDYYFTSGPNNFFKAEFVLTKDNKVEDIKIINGISKRFDQQFITGLKNAQRYFDNTFAKKLIITQEFTLFQKNNDVDIQTEKKFFLLRYEGSTAFKKNDFATAIVSYSALDSIPGLTPRFSPLKNECYIKWGISYLALGKRDEACLAFRKVGDITNFSVRQYLIKFCK